MVYTSDDPIVAKQLKTSAGVAIHAAGLAHRLRHGILNRGTCNSSWSACRSPVIVDAGVGTASDAAIAMELGCHGVLMNTASPLRRTRC